MPIAFILVAMITLLSGWYQMENRAHEMEMIHKSESQAVASNISAYHLKVMKCARYKNPATGNLDHWAAFNAFRGDAKLFFDTNCVGTPGPNWLDAPFDGVQMTIVGPDGSDPEVRSYIVVDYVPVRGLHASRAGVQAELNRMTDNSIILGQKIRGY